MRETLSSSSSTTTSSGMWVWSTSSTCSIRFLFSICFCSPSGITAVTLLFKLLLRRRNLPPIGWEDVCCIGGSSSLRGTRMDPDDGGLFRNRSQLWRREFLRFPLGVNSILLVVVVVWTTEEACLLEWRGLQRREVRGLGGQFLRTALWNRCKTRDTRRGLFFRRCRFGSSSITSEDSNILYFLLCLCVCVFRVDPNNQTNDIRWLPKQLLSMFLPRCQTPSLLYIHDCVTFLQESENNRWNCSLKPWNTLLEYYLSLFVSCTHISKKRYTCLGLNGIVK